MKRNNNTDQRGATMVEAALSIVLFCFILVCGMQMALTVYQGNALNYALAGAGRYAVLGLSESGSTIDAIKSKLIKRSAELGVTLHSANIRVCADENARCAVDDTEEKVVVGNEWIYISAQTSARFLNFIPGSTVSREIYVRNEPF